MRILFLLLIIGLLICTACERDPSPMIRVEDINCNAMGYIHIDDANELVRINNKIVTLVNACYQNENVTPLPHLREFEYPANYSLKR